MTAMVRAGGLQGYESLMRSLGADPRPLMQRHGVTAAMLSDEDCLLPLTAALDLLEDSAAQTECYDFGLRLARTQDITSLGPLALAIQHCATLAEALACMSRFLFVQSPGISMSVRPQGDIHRELADLRYDITAPGRHFPRQAYDHGMGVAHHILGFLAGAGYRLHAVSLPYRPQEPLLAHARFFGAEIRTEQPLCALHLNRACLDTPVRSANAALLRVATDYLAAHFAGPTSAIAPRVRLALSHALSNTGVDKEGVAAMLSMHPRTLQRRLDQEGTSFNAIRDEVRRQLATRYLTNTQLPLSQVAGLLGFSEQSTLTRFCRQRMGLTPSAIRAETSGRLPARQRPASPPP